MSDTGKESTPSLIGGSIRSVQDQDSSPISSSRSPSKSNVKKGNSHNRDYTSVNELVDEGALVQDDIVYDELLDESGKFRPSVSQTPTPTAEKSKDKAKLKRKPPTTVKESNDDKAADNEISLEDLIDSQIASMSELSTDFQKRISDKRTKPRALDSSRSRSNRRKSKLPESVIENDSLHQVPAGAPEGSDSPLVQSRSTSTAPKEKKTIKTSAERPNLAGGESYRGIHSEYRPGRKPVRDEVSTPLAHTSEDYLRSVSTSRSRVADLQPDNNELYDEGALLHDPEHSHELDVARDDAIDKLTDKPIKAKAVTDVTIDEAEEQKAEPKLTVSKDKQNVDDAKERLRKLSQSMQNKGKKSKTPEPATTAKTTEESVDETKATEATSEPKDDKEAKGTDDGAIAETENDDKKAEDKVDDEIDDSVVIVDESTIPSQKSLEKLESSSRNAEDKYKSESATAENKSTKDDKHDNEVQSEETVPVEQTDKSEDNVDDDQPASEDKEEKKELDAASVVPDIEDLSIKDVHTGEVKDALTSEKEDPKSTELEESPKENTTDAPAQMSSEKEVKLEAEISPEVPTELETTEKPAEVGSETAEKEVDTKEPELKDEEEVEDEDTNVDSNKSKTLETQTGDEAEVLKDIPTVADAKVSTDLADDVEKAETVDESDLLKGEVLKKEAKEAEKGDKNVIADADVDLSKDTEDETTLEQQKDTVDAVDEIINKKADDKPEVSIDDKDLKEEEPVSTTVTDAETKSEDTVSANNDESEAEALESEDKGSTEAEATSKKEIEQELKDITKDDKAKLPDAETLKDNEVDDDKITDDGTKAVAATDDAEAEKEDVESAQNPNIESSEKEAEPAADVDNKKEDEEDIEKDAEDEDDDDVNEADVSGVETITKGVQALGLKSESTKPASATNKDIKEDTVTEKADTETKDLEGDDKEEAEVSKVADPAGEAERLIKELEDAIDEDVSTDSIAKDESKDEIKDETTEDSTKVEEDVEKVSKDIVPETKEESDAKAKDLGHIAEKDNATSEVNVVKEDSKEVKSDTPVTKEVEPESKPVEAKAEVPSDDVDLDHEPTREEIIELLKDEPVYLYTSLAGGGFHMPHRTNRLATILTGNQIPFTYRDLGTDEEARNVWRRYSRGRLLPAVVRGKDDIIGNFQEIDEANEEYRVRELVYETL